MAGKSKQLEEIRDFVAKLMLEEQDRHADLINKLRSQIGYNMGNDLCETLLVIHEARMKLLDTIYDKIKRM